MPSQPPVQAPANNAFTFKPVQTRPKSPPRQASPEIDVDVSGMSPEPEGQGEDMGIGAGMERDIGSEEIVRQLEKGLPRWGGFGENGWMNETDPVRSRFSVWVATRTHGLNRVITWILCTQ